MTSREENVRREVLPFSFSTGVRKIMDHFVVKVGAPVVAILPRERGDDPSPSSAAQVDSVL